MKRLFTQFSFPGGIPSHVAPETPGSIHEGGELGYALSHAYGAVFDNPDLIVACVVGDGEAETGPLATGWHGNKFINPARDGVVLPILHLNGYKIANPTVLARISHEELDALMRGYGYTPHFVEGVDPAKMHQLIADTLDRCVSEIETIQADARKRRLHQSCPLWPMIVFRSPKGWTGPKEVDGQRTRGLLASSHQVASPLAPTETLVSVKALIRSGIVFADVRDRRAKYSEWLFPALQFSPGHDSHKSPDSEVLPQSTLACRTDVHLMFYRRPIRRPAVIVVEPVLILASDGHRIVPLRAVLDGFPGEVYVDFGVRPTHTVRSTEATPAPFCPATSSAYPPRGIESPRFHHRR